MKYLQFCLYNKKKKRLMKGPSCYTMALTYYLSLCPPAPSSSASPSDSITKLTHPFVLYEHISINIVQELSHNSLVVAYKVYS